ncbi:MAG: ABC transporter ATP-binding protein [Candidatus Auribacterota bacterium]|jgi:iron complex transport system ATP-binding protein|nr:ABC transporter ATP-binding protein [Candidatus Auribacterota bacterium]
MTTHVLNVDNLHYRVNGKTILDGVSFTVNKGERVSVIGPNGAGKTTLLRCIARYVKPTEGSISVCGSNIRRLSQKQLARLAGYIPQKTIFGYPYTVHEFVGMGRYPYASIFGVHDEQHNAIIDRILDETHLTYLQDRYITTLSGGESQKVLVAGCLAQEPQLLLLDEVMTHLDPHHQQDLLTLLYGLNKRYEITIVSVTHDVNAAMLFSDKILAMKDGRIQFYDTPDKLTVDLLKDLFQVEFSFVKHPHCESLIALADWEVPHA